MVSSIGIKSVNEEPLFHGNLHGQRAIGAADVDGQAALHVGLGGKSSTRARAASSARLTLAGTRRRDMPMQTGKPDRSRVLLAIRFARIQFDANVGLGAVHQICRKTIMHQIHTEASSCGILAQIGYPRRLLAPDTGSHGHERLIRPLNRIPWDSAFEVTAVSQTNRLICLLRREVVVESR